MSKVKFNALVLITAFVSLMAELIQTHVLTITWGGMITQLTLVFATYIFSLGLGAAFTPLKNHPLNNFANLQLVLSFLGYISPFFLLYVNYHFSNTFSIIASYVFVALIGFLSGFELPLLFEIRHRESPAIQETFENLMAYDYLGMALGSLLFSMLFLNLFGFWNSVFLNSTLNASIGVLILVASNKKMNIRAHWLRLTSGLILICLGIMSILFENQIAEMTRAWIVN
jgi:predicted membrane-bound spermidine synthase